MIFKLYDLTEARVLNIKYLRHQRIRQLELASSGSFKVLSERTRIMIFILFNPVDYAGGGDSAYGKFEKIQTLKYVFEFT